MCFLSDIFPPLYYQLRVWVRAKSPQSCRTPCDPTDCSPPDFSVRGVPQARTLEWAATPFSMDY